MCEKPDSSREEKSKLPSFMYAWYIALFGMMYAARQLTRVDAIARRARDVVRDKSRVTKSNWPSSPV